MATFRAGYDFTENEQVTPDKLNRLVDSASLTGLHATNFAGGRAQILFYGATPPTLSRGAFWYDTTVGQEGLKYAFISPSVGSISRWFYATPRRDCIAFASTNVSAFTPLFVARGAGHRNPSETLGGYECVAFDGLLLPKVYPYAGATGANPAMIVAMESVGPSNPVVCAWSGLVQGVFNNSPNTAGNPVFTNYANPAKFREDTFVARLAAWGVQMRSVGSAVDTLPMLIWGAGPAFEDWTP